MATPDRAQLPEDPRVTVLAQQRTLRRFLENVVDLAQAASGGDEVGVALLSYAALGVQVAFERLVATEERVMLPVLEAELPMGPERIARWRLEHGRKLRDLTAIVEGGTRDASVLADTLRAIAIDLLAPPR